MRIEHLVSMDSLLDNMWTMDFICGQVDILWRYPSANPPEMSTTSSCPFRISAPARTTRALPIPNRPGAAKGKTQVKPLYFKWWTSWKSFCVVVVLGESLFASAAMAKARDQVGDMVSRPAMHTTENALTAIQQARDSVKHRLGAIAAQADPLAGALAAYKKEPSPRTAIELLQREAVVAGIGASESEKIALEADSVAKTCADLAAQCAQQAAALAPDSAKADRARAEYDTAKSVGLGELRELHRSLSERGVTNDVLISVPERRKISRLLQLYGAADLAERFLRMEANANQAALAKLNEMAEQFTARQRDFADLGAAYRLHAASFQTVGGSVGRIAHLIDVNQRFDLESKSAAELQTELGRMDEVLAKTFDSLPDDLTPIFASGVPNESKPAPIGLWDRLLRLIGMGKDKEAESVPVVRVESPK